MSLVVMAAGMGSRYGGLKQMDGLGPNGEWILEYSIYDAIQVGFEHIVFVLNASIIDEFKSIIDQKIPKDIKVDYVVQDIQDIPSDVPNERTKPWGTAHAIYAARRVLKNPFAVINADDFYGRDAYQKVYDGLNNDDFVLVGYDVINTLTENGHVSRGLCEVKDHFLKSIEEKLRIEIVENQIISYEEENLILSEEDTVSMNMWGFNTKLLKAIDEKLKVFLEETVKENPLKAEFFLPGVVDEMIQENDVRVKVLKTHEKWFGVTYADDKTYVMKRLKDLIESGVYPDHLWEV